MKRSWSGKGNTFLCYAICLGGLVVLVILTYLGLAEYHFKGSLSFEARVLDRIPIEGSTGQRVVPRYAHSELNIRSKLFVGVLLGDGADSANNAIAFHKNLRSVLPSVVFFKGEESTARTTSDMKTVIVTGPTPALSMVSYTAREKSSSFDNFLFLTDTVYIDGRRLMDILSYTSVSTVVHAGGVSSTGTCGISSGLLLSKGLLDQLGNGLRDCKRDLGDETADDFLSQCLMSLGKTVPACNRGKFTIKSMQLGGSENALGQLEGLIGEQTPVLVYPVNNAEVIMALHIHFTSIRISELKEKIRETKEELAHVAKLSGNKDLAETWPGDLPRAAKPKNPSEVQMWTYIANDKVYFPDEQTQVRDILDVEKEDIDEVLEEIKSQYSLTIDDLSIKVVSVHQRFDITRGIEYKFVLNVSATSEAAKHNPEVRASVGEISESGTILFFEGFRGLARPTLEVTELLYGSHEPPVTIILSLYEWERTRLSTFFRSFASTCLATRQAPARCRLILMLTTAKEDFHDPGSLTPFDLSEPSASAAKSPFSSVRADLLEFKKRYNLKPQNCSWTTDSKASGSAPTFTLCAMEFQSRTGSQVDLFDLIANKFAPESLIFLSSTVSANMNYALLTNIKENSMRGKQIFSPIAFWQYKTKAWQKNQQSIPISRYHGMFDENIYRHISFYVEDYLEAKATLESSETPPQLVWDVFRQTKSSVQIFRAIEPKLQVGYYGRNCNTRTQTTGLHGGYDQCVREMEDHAGAVEDLVQMYMKQHNISADG